MRYFLAVAELGSFSKAAERCHVSQPALSVQIQKLEARLGKLLLNRNHRRIVPTDAGQILAKRAKQILELIESVKQEIRNSDKHHSSKVTIGVLPTIAPSFMTQVLDSFVEQHPKIQVCIHENMAEQSLQLIETGKLDLGIFRLPIRESGFQTELLFSEEMMVALPPSHPLVRKKEIFKEDLLSEKFILSEEDHSLGDCLIAFHRQHNFQPRIIFRSGQLATIHSLVAAGKGISLIPQTAIAETKSPITYRRLEKPRPTRSIAVVTRNKRSLKHSAQEFLAHLRHVGKKFKLPVANNQSFPPSEKPKA